MIPTIIPDGCVYLINHIGNRTTPTPNDADNIKVKNKVMYSILFKSHPFEFAHWDVEFIKKFMCYLSIPNATFFF